VKIDKAVLGGHRRGHRAPAAGIDRALIAELGTCHYLESATNILLIGPPVIAGSTSVSLCFAAHNYVAIETALAGDWFAPRRASSRRRSRFSLCPQFKGVAKRLQLLVMLLLQVGDQAWCELRPRCDALA
jgi:hypothetical protein